MIEPLTLQAARGQRAAEDLRDAENLMSRLAAWDLLRTQEKVAEHAKGAQSRFYGIPGFEPSWCQDCQSEVFLDYTQEPDGDCPFGVDHLVRTVTLDLAAA